MKTGSLIYLIPVFAIILESCQPNSKGETFSVEQTNYNDTVFSQEYHEAYSLGKGWDIDVRSIALDLDDNVWIATGDGVFRKNVGEQSWLPVLLKEEQGPSFDVEVDQESVWFSTWNGVFQFRDGKLHKMPGATPPISTLCISREGVYALGPKGTWLCSRDKCELKNFPTARSIRDAISDNEGGIWVGTDVGLYHCTPESTRHFVNKNDVISAYISSVATDGPKIWAGGLGGVTMIENDKKIDELLPKDGIPSINVNCIERSPKGVMWVGTDVGVVRYRPDNYRDTHSLLFSRRWLMDDKVNDIAFDSKGNAWVATANGVSAIKQKTMTLATKQLYFYDVLMARHIREPWIAGQCRLPIAGDTTRWEPEDDDNDGEYGGNYLAMESFRYAATKSEDARTKAAKAFRFLKLLQEVTNTDGFFARTIVPSEWTSVHDGNRVYSEREMADALVKEPRFKPVAVRWRKSEDGKWLWKGDTSSDEICGHMFGYYFYYELAADDEEKKIVRKHVAGIVDHLVRNNYSLTDVDGQSTRWGVWSPDKLNRDPEWSPDRNLNSMELLGFLKLAYYMTDDEKYQTEYLRLIKEEKYLENMGNIPAQNKAWFVYYDVILAAYAYPVLLKCEKDPHLLKIYVDHIDKWIETRKNDNNPLINFIYCYSRNKKVELPSSIALLKDTPLDLIDWTIDHSKREDIDLVRQPTLDEIQVSVLQPASIRSTIRWDKNPWAVNAGNHNMEREPVFWLLPYWMGRYLGMINEQ
ncbi:MAG TPA: hypothetical protein VK589_31150 [Chryseolinea sp.]|nr:hypothetical protein [Chryseolinea sp.]